MLGLNLTKSAPAGPLPLRDATPMGFLAVSDFDQARAFYEGILGLTVFSRDEYALVLRSGSTLIRLTKPPQGLDSLTATMFCSLASSANESGVRSSL